LLADSLKKWYYHTLLHMRRCLWHVWKCARYKRM